MPFFARRLMPCLLVGLLAMSGSAALAQSGPSLTDMVEAWLASPHARRADEAFSHWDEEGAVPENCATCHSGPGLIDFVGGDGTAAGVVDHPAPTGSPIDCASCHNAASAALDTVTFPSGEVVGGLGSSSICMVCHQGRKSSDSVNAAVAGTEDDTINVDLGFLNIHYRAAAATLLGGTVRGGYQYDGREYVGQFAHVAPLNTCTGCHEPHSTEVTVTGCASCHAGAKDPKAIRIAPVDYDGDGNATEGVHGEVATLHEVLGATIQTYASEVVGTGIVYDAGAYPYFFVDTDGNGAVSDGEAAFPNRFQTWTPRLLKAAYNYQFVAKDPGAYVHNPKYVLQLLYDSVAALGEATASDTSALVRP